jgi:hypothetical protein
MRRAVDPIRRNLAEERHLTVHLPVVPLEPAREDVVDPLVELLDWTDRADGSN